MKGLNRPDYKVNEEKVGMSVVIGIFGVWSTLGNLLTIIAITTNRCMKTKCNYFILSLACSDLISGLIASPLWLYRRTWGFNTWSWGEFLCKLFWFVDESTSYCTAMHIASFAVWRYVLVKWPHAMDTIKKSTIKLWICLIWTTAIVFGGGIFSTFYALNDKSSYHKYDNHAQWPACTIKIAEDGVNKHLIYYTFSSSMFMFLPMLILIVSSVLIVKELFCNKNPEHRSIKKKEMRAAWQLMLISTSFLFGYVPMASYVMWTTRTPHTDKQLDYWLHVASYFSLRISECLNPIIYNIASSNMRRASKKVLHFIGNCCKTDAEIEFVHSCSNCKNESLRVINLPITLHFSTPILRRNRREKPPSKSKSLPRLDFDSTTTPDTICNKVVTDMAFPRKSIFSQCKRRKSQEIVTLDECTDETRNKSNAKQQKSTSNGHNDSNNSRHESILQEKNES